MSQVEFWTQVLESQVKNLIESAKSWLENHETNFAELEYRSKMVNLSAQRLTKALKTISTYEI